MLQKSINIFDSDDSYKGDFVRIIYTQLMKKGWVSYMSVYTEWSGEDVDLETNKVTALPKYGELQKAFKLVRDAISQAVPNSIETNGKTKGVAYRYVGGDLDPLRKDKEIISHMVKKSISDYASFCQASLGMFPQGWYSHFFENTQDYIEAERKIQLWSLPLRSGMEQSLVNIELLPLLFDTIVEKKVLKFNYKPFDKNLRTYIFHPQFLKEYNYRWFLLGKAEGCKQYPFIVALDRIQGHLDFVKGKEYEPAPLDYYKHYFENIIGVRREDAPIETVVIRTHSEYMHNLLLSKPWHATMHQVCDYSLQEDGESYGLISLTVTPNVELQGKILMFGSGISVQSPLWFRKQIEEEIKKQLVLYANEN